MVCSFIGFVQSYGGLITGRMFLGMCEGGLVGGMLVYLALFYRRHQLLYRIGMFACAAPLAVAFGGLLATGLSKISHDGYNGNGFSWLVRRVLTLLSQDGRGSSLSKELQQSASEPYRCVFSHTRLVKQNFSAKMNETSPVAA